MSFQTLSVDGIEVTHGWDAADDATGGERRSYMRYPLDIAGSIVLAADRILECRILDFSAHGMRLLHAPRRPYVSGASSHPAPAGVVGVRPRTTAPEPFLETARIDSPGADPADPADAADDTQARLADIAQALRPGALVKLLITLPDTERRIRAKAQIRRRVLHDGAIEVGIQYARINIEVFKSLLAASDGRRFKRVEDLSPKELAAAVSKPWQHTACLLENAIEDFFVRAEERLRLHAESAVDAATLGPFFYSLIELRNQQVHITCSFVRDVYNQIAQEQASLERELDEYKSATMELPELDPNAPAYRWDLAHLARKPEPFSARLLNAEHSPLAPESLSTSLMRACAGLQSAEGVQAILREVSEEISARQFTQLQRILRPIAWRDNSPPLRRRRRTSIDLAGTEFESRV
ncbi:MAG: PilZ domain-containing protein [Gammaproteobacteria bacterium]|nr:PilZ domain-containing protein [Gammaproteobacteria bacterium]